MKLQSDCGTNLALRRNGRCVRLRIPLAVAFLGLAIVSGNLAAQYRAPDAAPDLIRLIRSEETERDPAAGHAAKRSRHVDTRDGAG